jgi:hypothetical protein
MYLKIEVCDFRDNSESLPPRLGSQFGPAWNFGTGSPFWTLTPPLPSLYLLISVSSNDLMHQTYPRTPSSASTPLAGQSKPTQALRPQPVSKTRWPLPYRLPRFSSAAHLTRSRSSCHDNPALQSQGGQDNTESQTVQGASQPTRPTLSAGGAQVRR